MSGIKKTSIGGLVAGGGKMYGASKNLAIPTFALIDTIIGPESLTAMFGMGKWLWRGRPLRAGVTPAGNCYAK